MREQAQGLEVSEKQIEILARRLLPEIRRFFTDENVRKEFDTNSIYNTRQRRRKMVK